MDANAPSNPTPTPTAIQRLGRQPHPAQANPPESNRPSEDQVGLYRLMDFLHLAEAIDLGALASVLRPFVGADFRPERDRFTSSMVARWDGHEVVVSHPLESLRIEHPCGGPLTEANAPAAITLALKRSAGDERGIDHWQADVVASIAVAVSSTFDIEVLHSKTWRIDDARTTVWNRRYRGSTTPLSPPEPQTFSSGWKRIALVTTVESLRPRHDGPLDFMFAIHPRAVVDKRRPFPLMQGLTTEMVNAIQPACTVLGPIEVPIDGRLLRGELVSIPHAPEEMFDRLSDARDAAVDLLEYAEHRKARFVGLGALIPSITRHGRLLKSAKPSMAITTGHGLTAVTIARMVHDIEHEIGAGGVVAVMGAAGSTGRAALRCMFRRDPSRRILAVDLPEQVGRLPGIPGWDPAVHRFTTRKEEIKEASIVVCVTNALGSILGADDFGPNTVILDDAQPENVDRSVLAARPDLRVVKCLTRIPGLHCPFDMGLFTAEHLDPEVNFTCLAEVILAAADRNPAACVVGDPSDAQLDALEQAARRRGVGPAEFISYPGLGAIDLRPRT